MPLKCWFFILRSYGVGIAQERLALDAGVDRTVVSKIERAVANPSIEILLKLANQLDVDLNDLFAN
jgi:transcriptional regulator with XRE-family HTH domain